MTDYRRPPQTNKDQLIDGTSRGLETLMALLARRGPRGQLVPNATAKLGPLYQGAIDATSQWMDGMALAGQNIGNDLITSRNDLYKDIDQMSGLQGRVDNMFASQQAASDQAFARGQELFKKPGRQAQYAMQQMGAPQTLLDLLNPGQPAYEALNSGQTAIDDMIAQLHAAGNSEKAQALLQLKQEMAAKAAEIYHGTSQQAQQGYNAAGAKAAEIYRDTSQQAQQGYDAVRAKAADLIQRLMGN